MQRMHVWKPIQLHVNPTVIQTCGKCYIIYRVMNDRNCVSDVSCLPEPGNP